MAIHTTTTVNADYTVTSTDEIILVDSTGGPVVITLIAPPAVGKRYEIKDREGVTANLLTQIRIETADTAKIDNSTFYDLTTNRQSVTVHTDGVDWYVL